MNHDTHTLEELVSAGVYVFAGLDDSGEATYSLNVNVAKEKAPDIYWADRNALETALLDAIDEGYLEWDFDPDTLEDVFYVTEKGEGVI